MVATLNRFCTLILMITVIGCDGQREDLSANDIRLFVGESWDLAQAISSEDLIKIRSIIKVKPNLVAYQESTYGQSLLHWAVRMNKQKAVKELLENGADPDLQDTYDGESPLMIASGYGLDYDTSSVVLTMLLANGANPNSEEKTPRRPENRTRKTPLIIASGCCLNKTKILVASGANINYTNEFNESPLRSAMIGGRDAVDITKFLLIEKEAKIPPYFSLSFEGKPITILNYLRDWVFKVDTREYKVKMEIVEYLKNKGLDYWSTPIPEIYSKKYPKEFLEKY